MTPTLDSLGYGPCGDSIWWREVATVLDDDGGRVIARVSADSSADGILAMAAAEPDLARPASRASHTGRAVTERILATREKVSRAEGSPLRAQVVAKEIRRISYEIGMYDRQVASLVSRHGQHDSGSAMTAGTDRAQASA